MAAREGIRGHRAAAPPCRTRELSRFPASVFDTPCRGKCLCSSTAISRWTQPPEHHVPLYPDPPRSSRRSHRATRPEPHWDTAPGHREAAATLRRRLNVKRDLIYSGSRGRTRTGMPLRTADFESAASAIPPLGRSCETIADESTDGEKKHEAGVDFAVLWWSMSCFRFIARRSSPIQQEK